MLKTFLKREPFSATLRITNRCNSKCVMCNVWKEKEKKDLTAIELKEILNSRLMENIMQFNISGGEPFLNKDLKDLIDILIHDTNVKKISIITNGLSNNIVPTMKELIGKHGLRMFRVKVSLDGTREIYKSIRGVDGYDTVKQNINNLLALNIDVSIGFVSMQKNEGELIKLQKEFKCDIIAHPLDSYYGNTTTYEKSFKRPKNNNIFFRIYYLFMYKTIKRKKRIHCCHAGRYSVVIDQDLNVYSCIKKRFSFGNLKDDNFDNLWKLNIEEVEQLVKNFNCYCYCPGDVLPSIIRNPLWYFKEG